MNRKQNTLIYYHVPEDYDRPEDPNVFLLPISKNKVQLQHIFQHFPLKGTYTFRFKIAYNDLIVWLDLNDPQAIVPTFKENIHLKANRISWQQFKNHNSAISQNRSSGKSINKKESIDLFDHHPQPTPMTKEQNRGNLGDINLLDGNSPVNSPTLHPTISEPSFKVDFFSEEKPQENLGFQAQNHKEHNHNNSDLI